MRHVTPIVRAVPVLRPRRTPDGIADSEAFGRVAAVAHPAAAGQDADELAAGVGVPVCAGAGGECYYVYMYIS